MYLFLILAVTSCFEDKGNYEYIEIDDIEVSNYEQDYSVKSAIDILNIEPLIEEADKYTFTWSLYPEPNSGEIYDKPVEHDTISVEQNLSTRIAKASGLYKLILAVQSKDTGIKEIISMNLEVTDAFSNGWYVLKEEQNVSDIDFYNEDSSVENLLDIRFGKKLGGMAVSLSLMPSYAYRVPGMSEQKKSTVLYATSDENTVMLDTKEMEIVMEDNNIFFGSSIYDDKKIKYVSYSETSALMVTDNSAHFINTNSGHGQFGNSLAALDGVKLSKYRYTMPDGIMGTVVFDETNSSFKCITNFRNELKVNSYFNTTEDGIDPNNMDYDLIYMGYLRSYPAFSYPLMRHKTTGEMIILKMHDNAMMMDFSNPFMQTITIPSTYMINNANNIAHNIDTPHLYYCIDNKVYMLDINLMQESLLLELPIGEESTFIRNFYLRGFSPAPGVPAEEPIFNLTIATHKDGEYNIYMYNIDDDATIDISSEVKFSGDGVVKDIHYSSSMMSERVFSYMNYPAF